MTAETARPSNLPDNLGRSSASDGDAEDGPWHEEQRLRVAIDNLVAEVGASRDVKEAIGALEDLVLQLRTANQNLLLATVKAQTMHEQAEAINRRQNEFIAMLAHELRNPLAPISNAATVLEQISSAHTVLPRIQGVISRQVQHMARLLDDLLDAARVNSGKIRLKKRPVSFAEIVERAVEVGRPYIEKRNQQLTIEIQATPMLVDGDLVRLAQVFSNLLINASNFTDDEGHIRLSSESLSDTVVLTVKDNGAGIAQDVQPYIFDLFTQGPRSLARTEGGLGVGLAVARGLVEMHGGTITVKSDGPGLGSEFIVTLPVHSIAQSEPAIPAPEKSSSISQCRILLIEDNIDANDTLKMMLELEGYTVDCAADGVTGLAMANADNYGVIICDIGLPGIDGLEVIAQLRQQTDRAAPFAIAISGYGQPQDKSRAMNAGFDDYLTKPVEGNALLNAVAAYASR